MAKEWSKAARKRAREYGRLGGLKGNREGKRVGGLVSWHGKTPEQQAAILEVFRAHGGKKKGTKANTSAKAREAQRARGKVSHAKPSGRQALFLADMGMYRVRPTTVASTLAPPTPVAPARAPAPGLPADWPEGRPHPSQYGGDTQAWLTAVNGWDSIAYRKKYGEPG